MTRCRTLSELTGFTDTITEVAAHSTSEPALACYYAIIDQNTIAMACGHDKSGGARPTGGTLSVGVDTVSMTASADVSYVLPPLSE